MNVASAFTKLISQVVNLICTQTTAAAEIETPYTTIQILDARTIGYRHKSACSLPIDSATLSFVSANASCGLGSVAE